MAAVKRQLAVYVPLVKREIAAWVNAGADLILLADDLAYSSGPYFSPSLCQRLLFSHYQQLSLAAVPQGIPLGFHSDGDLTLLLPGLMQSGFSFFSLEPEAVNLLEVWERYGRHLTLLSGIPAAWLTGDVNSAAVLPELARLGGGSLILSSCCGLFDPVCIPNLKAIYHLADCGS